MSEMTNPISEGHHGGDDRGQQDVKRALRRGALSLGGFILLLAICLFLPAGSLAWLPGWVFLATYLVLTITAIWYLWRTNPDVVVARSTYRRRGQTAAQSVILVVLLVSFVGMFPVAALDAGRFHWSGVPLWLTLVGYLLLLFGMAGNVWVLSVNKFAEPSVRIQTERSQKLVDTGPYAIVRHPLYTTAFFLVGGIPLALGSYWAFVPAALGAAAVVVRTALEDHMLQNELAGYKEYAGRVRYRLIPGIW